MSETKQFVESLNSLVSVDSFYRTSSFQLCLLCHMAANSAIILRKLGVSKEIFSNLATFICVALNGYSVNFCNDIVKLNIDALTYIMDNKPDISSNHVCGLVAQPYHCSPGAFDWSIDIPPGLPHYRKPVFDRSPGLKIVHLTDMHYDPTYQVNGTSKCKEPICCQPEHGTGTTPENTCPKWGAYDVSDSPFQLIEQTVAGIKAQNPDYIYFTGDVISHRSWDASSQKNAATLKTTYEYLRKSFDVPIYPVLGNHETHPLNIWTPPSVTEEAFSQRWLFELAAEQFSLLVGEDVRETVLKGGYYTVSPRPGFRIIALNNNYAYIYNFWLMYENNDPFGQLKWLVETLKKAESDNESVHILMHIPTGANDTFSVWAREYTRIVDRFSHVITGQFVGHTHLDEWQLIYSRTEPEKPTGVIFNGGSVTPYISNNPNFKTFDVSSSNFAILDYYQWTCNLSIANSQPDKPIEWYKLYSFSDLYGTENLDPLEIDQVIYKMVDNPTLLHIYHQLKSRNSINVDNSCDDDCKTRTLCEILTSVHGESQHCAKFSKLLNEKSLGNSKGPLNFGNLNEDDYGWRSFDSIPGH